MAESVSSGDELQPVDLGASYVANASDLRAFLTGLLRNTHLADEALQATFGKALLHQEAISPDSMRAWLFQVAYREAMAIRRRQGVEARALEKLSWVSRRRSEAPEEDLVRRESIRRVRVALEALPPDQRLVVQKRIHEEQTFAEIAAELNVPLGTVLTRMRLALNKLRAGIRESE